MEGDVILEPGPGGGGLMCGSGADTDDFLDGAVNGANEWAIAHIHDSQLLLVWVEGRFAGAASAIPSLAPYLNVGVYALSGAAALTVHADDLRILGGPEYQPIPQV